MMSTLDGKFTNVRLPLQEQQINNSNSLYTPLPNKNGNQKITTPPESIATSRKKSLSFETPVKTFHDNTIRPNSINDVNRNLLLSPAFSSPQNQFSLSLLDQHSRPQSHTPPPKPSFGESTSSQSSDDKKRKIKKSKKDKKVFDIYSNDKPPYSYATLIGMSILSHPEKRLTLALIYLWISDTFKYYKREDVGWQNSIRHNLSLNKAFIKGDKSKDGKGHYWCIESGFEDQFLKSRNNKKSSFHEIMDQIHAGRQDSRCLNSLPSSPNYDQSFTDQDNENDITNDNDQSITDQDNDRSRGFSKPEISISTSYNKHLHDNDDDDDDDFLPPNKRQKMRANSNDIKDNLGYGSNLGAPFTQSSKELRPTMPKQSMSTPIISNENLMNTPQFVISDSPSKPTVAGKNLTFTSSFSCNSNLELSPIRPNETGPLLEPLTPSGVYKSGAINHHMPSLNYHQGINSQSSSNNNHGPTHSIGSHLMKTPKTGITPKANNIRTPMRILKTPQASTSQKKLWHSPSYLDDFYYSPLISSQPALHSYDDDDMILRAFESPANSRKQANESNKVLFPDSKKYDKLSKLLEKEGDKHD